MSSQLLLLCSYVTAQFSGLGLTPTYGAQIQQPYGSYPPPVPSTYPTQQLPTFPQPQLYFAPYTYSSSTPKTNPTATVSFAPAYIPPTPASALYSTTPVVQYSAQAGVYPPQAGSYPPRSTTSVPLYGSSSATQATSIPLYNSPATTSSTPLYYRAVSPPTPSLPSYTSASASASVPFYRSAAPTPAPFPSPSSGSATSPLATSSVITSAGNPLYSTYFAPITTTATTSTRFPTTAAATTTTTTPFTTTPFTTTPFTTTLTTPSTTPRTTTTPALTTTSPRLTSTSRAVVVTNVTRVVPQAPPTSLYAPRSFSSMRPNPSSAVTSSPPTPNPDTITSNSSPISVDPVELYGNTPSALHARASVRNPLKPNQTPSVVSFDFDGTLQDNAAGGGVGAPFPKMIAFLKHFAQEGAKVVIVTQRYASDNPAIETFLAQNGISQYVKHIYNSETGDKTASLIQAGAQVHVDDRVSNLDILKKTLPKLKLYTVVDGAPVAYN